MAKISRQLSRTLVRRALREFEALSQLPPNPGKDTAAEAGTEAAAGESNDKVKGTPTRSGQQE